jgi:putative flippase GtrA
VFRRFMTVSIAAFLASEALLAGLEAGLQLPHRLSLAIVVLIIPAISFLLNKLWVYRHPDTFED